MSRKLKTDAIPSGLITHLGSVREYLDESMEIAKKMVTFIGKQPSELTDDEKAILKRSSELVILLETTATIERIK